MSVMCFQKYVDSLTVQFEFFEFSKQRLKNIWNIYYPKRFVIFVVKNFMIRVLLFYKIEPKNFFVTCEMSFWRRGHEKQKYLLTNVKSIFFNNKKQRVISVGKKQRNFECHVFYSVTLKAMLTQIDKFSKKVQWQFIYLLFNWGSRPLLGRKINDSASV